MARFDWLLFTDKYWEGKPNTTLFKPKSQMYNVDNVFHGQMNDKNLNASLGKILVSSAEIDDKFECVGVPSNNLNY